MKILKLIINTALLILMVQLLGCTTKETKEFIDASTQIPYVDRTEKEIDDWFSNNNIIIFDDTKMGTPGVINGKPTVLLKTNSEICITQYNQLPEKPLPEKYEALIVINVLNNSSLFEVGEITLESCNTEAPLKLQLMKPNLAFGRLQPDIKQAFRESVNRWLASDIIDTLKSNNNTDGLERLKNPAPRIAAKTRGVRYAVTEDRGPPAVRSIFFIAN